MYLPIILKIPQLNSQHELINPFKIKPKKNPTIWTYKLIDFENSFIKYQFHNQLNDKKLQKYLSS